jgi:hypothetical protein
MTNACGYCEHSVTTHHLGWGRCNGASQDPEYGTYACVCPHFELDNSDD